MTNRKDITDLKLILNGDSNAEKEAGPLKSQNLVKAQIAI